MTTDKDFEQFEDDNDVDETAPPKTAPAKKAPAKRAPAKKSTSKKELAAEPERDQETAEAADDARVDEATSDDDSVELVVEKTVEVNEPVLKNGSPVVIDGKVQQKTVERKLTFATKIPRNIGEWDGRVMRRFGQGRDEEGLIFLLGDAEFDRYLDIMQPKHKDVAPPLMSALTKALGLGADSGN